MHVISARNVNEAVSQGMSYLAKSGILEQSRNGDVLVAPGPVTTCYAYPMERVLFSPVRDANPFFHFMEGLWMLAGREDVTFPLFFNSRFKEYSDDGLRLNGAYGYRWRTFFGSDQLMLIVDELRSNPESRRAVLGMWSPRYDLGSPSRDVPCNTHIYFDCRGGVLNMTVCCRSNDALWGAYGANVVHMSMLQEMMAAWIGVPIGVYRQVSNNFHIYTSVLSTGDLMALIEDAKETDLYTYNAIRPYPMSSAPESMHEWLADLRNFLFNPLTDVGYSDPFFPTVAVPIYAAWHQRKNKLSDGLDATNNIAAQDWRIACRNWIIRRNISNHFAPKENA